MVLDRIGSRGPQPEAPANLLKAASDHLGLLGPCTFQAAVYLEPATSTGSFRASVPLVSACPPVTWALPMEPRQRAHHQRMRAIAQVSYIATVRWFRSGIGYRWQFAIMNQGVGCAL
jgi:hypothetical protein